MRFLTLLICFGLAFAADAQVERKAVDANQTKAEDGKTVGNPGAVPSPKPPVLDPQLDTTTDLFLYSTRHTNTVKLVPGPDDQNIARFVALLLGRSHYLQKRMDDEIASKFLDRYLDTLDPLHMYFLQSDIQEFEPYRTTLDDLTIAGDTSPARVIFLRFLERFEQQVSFVAELFKTDAFDFSGQEVYVFNRKNLPRPKDFTEAKRLWRERVRYEYLQEKLNIEKGEAIGKIILEKLNQGKRAEIAKSLQEKLGKERIEELTRIIDEKAKEEKPDKIAQFIVEKLDREKHGEAVKIVARRYARLSRMLHEYDSDEVFEMYLTALSHVYDPHSDYMGRATLENFAIGMKLSLFGIGALLQSEDGYCKIKELTPGGPAIQSKKLKPGDRIISVAQGDKEPVDAVDMKLRKVVEMIRGPKGTVVRLTVIPADAPDPSMRKTVTLVRDEIKLEEQEAKAKIIEMPGEKGVRLGLIDLPSFYADFVVDGRQKEREPKSTTTDVSRLLKKLTREKVDGVILDLRRNGGGSLEEAINLTGLFIKEGPVVQVKDPISGKVMEDRDTDPSVLYDGPLIVLTSRFSASASEILAGALQDYGRALVVGDSSTHGKGTVQSLIKLQPLMDQYGKSPSNDPGALKITIRKFYRANGASTQLKGVIPDLVLPSLNNHAEVGEASLDNPLPWDTVPSATFEKLDRIQPYLNELRKRSDGRVSTNRDFVYLREEIERYKKMVAEKSVSLNEAQRLKEKKEAEARSEARRKELKSRPEPKEKIYDLTLKNVDLPGLPPLEVKTNDVAAAEIRKHAADDGDAESAETAADEKVPTIDITLEETKRILLDLIALSSKEHSVAARD